AQTRLYAANTSLGRIDVFDSNFSALDLGPDAFRDPSLPTGLVPFNVRDIGGNVYVVYAPAGRPAQIMAPPGAGAVAVFDRQFHQGSSRGKPPGRTLGHYFCTAKLPQVQQSFACRQLQLSP